MPLGVVVEPSRATRLHVLPLSSRLISIEVTLLGMTLLIYFRGNVPNNDALRYLVVTHRQWRLRRREQCHQSACACVRSGAVARSSGGISGGEVEYTDARSDRAMGERLRSSLLCFDWTLPALYVAFAWTLTGL